MALSATGFTGMSSLVKGLSATIPQFELVFFRSLVNLIWVVFLLRNSRSFLVPTQKLLLTRGLLGFVGVCSLFYTVSHLPLPIATLLSWSSPLFVIVFSSLILGEKLSRRSIKWVVLAFLGLLLLVQILGGDGTAQKISVFAIAIGLLGAASSGMAYVAVRAATARVGVHVIIYYLTLVSTVLSLPLALINGIKVPQSHELIRLIGVGAFASLGQFGMTHAYRHSRAALVSTMGMLNVAFSSLVGWLVFQELLLPLQWMGMALMVMSIAAATLIKE